MIDIETITRLASDSSNGINTLRETILSLAMHGKLVEQDTSDEPAEAMLLRLKIDFLLNGKADKGKAKQIPDFTLLNQSHHPYQLPNSWVWVKLSSIGEINPRNSLSNETQVGFIPMNLIQDGYANKHSFQIRKWSEVKQGFTHFQEGDVGVAKITPCFENRKSCVFRNLPNRMGAGTTELHIYRDTHNVFDPEFLLLYFKTESFISNGKNKMTGTAGQQRIPKSYFAETPIPLPPLTEQKRIVQKIDQLMSICDKLEELQQRRDKSIHSAHTASIKRLLSSANADEFASSWQFIQKHFDTFYSVKENVEELKKAILTLAMQGKLVQQNVSDTPVTELLNDIRKSKSDSSPITNIFNNRTDRNLTTEFLHTQIPQTWKWVRLEDYADLIMGQSPQSSSYNDKKEGLPFFQGKADFGDLSPKVSTWCSSPQKIAPPNSILISVRAPVGPTNICPFEACIGRGLAAINCLAGADNMYLMYYLRSIEGVIASYGTGSTFKAITKKVLQNLLIPVPPIEEQKRIVKRIECLLELSDRLEGQIEKSRLVQIELLRSIVKQAEVI